MKFLKIVLLFISFISFIVGKKKRQDMSPSSRNYRKMDAELSINPLPGKWGSGPNENYAVTTAKKYHDYVKNLHESHSYRDNSRTLNNIVAKRIRS